MDTGLGKDAMTTSPPWFFGETKPWEQAAQVIEIDISIRRATEDAVVGVVGVAHSKC